MTLSRFVALVVIPAFLFPAVGALAAPAPADGLIYATVTWPDGDRKTGFLRWDDEEACWDDLFHCGYRDLVWSGYVDLDEMRARRRDEYFRTHGLLDRLAYALDSDKENPLGWRMLISRFGDLQSIEIHDGEDDFAVTADGARHRIGGHGIDVGVRLYLYVAGRERERIRWNDLSGIVFEPAPADAVPYAARMYGTVTATTGVYSGFVQWDKSECLSTDVIDGENENGERDVQMGSIRSIARARDNTSIVVLDDGSELPLRGTNDVNSSNRGVMVEVVDLGRVTVPWNRFEQVVFEAGHGSGRARATFANADPLRGRAETTAGRVLEGQLVYDLDEAFEWDVLNGKDDDGLEYDIPFAQVVRIEPLARARCRVTLHSGRVLELGDDQDTGAQNGGVLVFGDGHDQPEPISWDNLRSIEFAD